MLRLRDLGLAIGGHSLLSGATAHVHPGEKIGLIGRNGSGKTTLLRAIAGEIRPDHGEVAVRPGVALGYLPQGAVSGSTQTVWDEARSGMDHLNGLAAELDAAQGAVEAHQDGAIDRLGRATEAFRLAGGYASDERVGEVLHGLGFSPDDWKRTCDVFSGGWQMRIALARLLLSDADLLLLDEPTNHLDLHARSWLAGFLERSDRTALIVSHDRYLLDRVARRILEIEHRTVTMFTGNLSAWSDQRAERDRQQELLHGRQQVEIAKLERFVERFGAKATKAAQARSKQKAIDRIDRVDAPVRKSRPRYVLPEPPDAAGTALSLRGASIGWSADLPILVDVDLEVTREQCIALLGPNGAGKSTLLQSLAGRHPLLGGRRVIGPGTRIGVFNQDLAQSLPTALTAAEAVATTAPAASATRIRSALGALGLSGDAALRPIGALSGGEKARVALATFAVGHYNALLLDEPTNHLDAVTVEVLADALRAWQGALVIATHDRYLVERVATHVAHVREGTLAVREGVRTEDFERPERLTRLGAPRERPGATQHQDRKRAARERERAQRRIDQLHDEVEQADARIAAIDVALIEAATDYVRANDLAAERSAAEADLEALYLEWEALEGVLGGALEDG